MTDKELMKMALDALEIIWDKGLDGLPESTHEAAIEALRARLAQPESELSPTVWCGCGDGIVPDDGAICGTCAMINRGTEPDLSTVKRIATQLGWKPPVDAEPDPVGYVYSEAWTPIKKAAIDGDIPNGTPLYTAPPQREWQSLTDGEIEQAFSVQHGGDMVSHLLGVARAIEAKLKEKNA